MLEFLSGFLFSAWTKKLRNEWNKTCVMCERTQRYNLGVVVLVNGALLTSPGEVNKVWSSTMRYMESIVHSEDFAACNIYSWAELSRAEREKRKMGGGHPTSPTLLLLPPLPPRMDVQQQQHTTVDGEHTKRPVPYWPLLNPVHYTLNTQ